jgi:hypothetical protein
MKYLLFLLVLTGCSTTVPVTAKFPVVPEKLLVKCPQLETAQKCVNFSYSPI